MFDLPEAPTFYPTDEEFADPHKYIQSIRHIGEKAGICKIVPPAAFKPPFSLNMEVRIPFCFFLSLLSPFLLNFPIISCSTFGSRHASSA